MKYTRNQINKAGELILSTTNKEIEKDAGAKINEWRSLHLPVLEELSNTITQMLEENNIKFLFSSQRLKRMPSILDKLDKNPNMRLGGLNDIGGLRFVFKNMAMLKVASAFLENNIPNNFNIKNIYDYIDIPKDSGYKSIHIVYQYHSEDFNYDGARIELQIRTKVQHNWATAVETAELITNMALKSSQGTTEWLSFFQVVSALFSIKENININRLYSEFSQEQLIQELKDLNGKYHCCSLLQAMTVSHKYIEENKYKAEYYLLNIDYNKRIVRIKSYNKENSNDAVTCYHESEKKLDYTKNAVVLVCVSDIKKLKEAYQSYFLDTTEFVSDVESFFR